MPRDVPNTTCEVLMDEAVRMLGGKELSLKLLVSRVTNNTECYGYVNWLAGINGEERKNVPLTPRSKSGTKPNVGKCPFKPVEVHTTRAVM